MNRIAFVVTAFIAMAGCLEGTREAGDVEPPGDTRIRSVGPGECLQNVCVTTPSEDRTVKFTRDPPVRERLAEGAGGHSSLGRFASKSTVATDGLVGWYDWDPPRGHSGGPLVFDPVQQRLVSLAGDRLVLTSGLAASDGVFAYAWREIDGFGQAHGPSGTSLWDSRNGTLRDLDLGSFASLAEFEDGWLLVQEYGTTSFGANAFDTRSNQRVQVVPPDQGLLPDARLAGSEVLFRLDSDPNTLHWLDLLTLEERTRTVLGDIQWILEGEGPTLLAETPQGLRVLRGNLDGQLNEFSVPDSVPCGYGDALDEPKVHSAWMAYSCGSGDEGDRTYHCVAVNLETNEWFFVSDDPGLGLFVAAGCFADGIWLAMACDPSGSIAASGCFASLAEFKD